MYQVQVPCVIFSTQSVLGKQSSYQIIAYDTKRDDCSQLDFFSSYYSLVVKYK